MRKPVVLSWSGGKDSALAKAAFESRVGFDWKLHTIVGVVIIAIGGLFSSLTIRVESGRLSWNFAIPAVSNSILLKDIASVEIVRNPFIYGWGMHMIRGGWVYNVSGRTAVEVKLHEHVREMPSMAKRFPGVPDCD